MDKDITIFGDGSVSVVFRMESRSGRDRPTVAGSVKETGEMQIQIAKNVDGIGIADMVHGCFPGVEFAFFFLVERMPAVAGHVMPGRFLGFVLACGLLRKLRMIVLGKGDNTQPAENQCDPIFANGYHIHVWKGFCQIGCKSTTWNSFLETGKIIFPKKMGQAGCLYDVIRI